MISFRSVLPELAKKETGWVQVDPSPDVGEEAELPADDYLFVEFYCPDLACDCRSVLVQVRAKHQPGKIFASIIYGWEKESFYRKRMPKIPELARGTVRCALDVLNEQSEFCDEFLDLFRRLVRDEHYRLRLQRHYLMMREALARRGTKL